MKSKNRYWFMAPVLALLFDILLCFGFASHYELKTQFDYFGLILLFIAGFFFFFVIFAVFFIKGA